MREADLLGRLPHGGHPCEVAHGDNQDVTENQPDERIRHTVHAFRVRGREFQGVLEKEREARLGVP